MDDHLSDSPVDWENIDYEGISEFMEKKGAVELLAFVDEHGYRFDEIDFALNLSRGYINKRKDEALNLDLIYPSQREREGEIRRIWALTQLGMIIGYKMGIKGVRRELSNLLSVRREYESSKDKFLEWSEEPENIEETVNEITNNEDMEDGFDMHKCIRNLKYDNIFDP